MVNTPEKDIILIKLKIRTILEPNKYNDITTVDLKALWGSPLAHQLAKIKKVLVQCFLGGM